MEKVENLEDLLGVKMALNRKVEEAFNSLPADNWIPFKRSKNSFQVAVYKANAIEVKTPIIYEIKDKLDQNNLFGQLLRDSNGVYMSKGKEYTENGKYSTHMFFLRKSADSYINVAFVNDSSKKVIFDYNEVNVMDKRQLRKFAYAINQYINGNYKL